MKTIFKYLAAAVVFYFGINWVADNPKMMKVLKTKVNGAVTLAVESINEI